jgi:hypothetical protein
LEDRIEVEIIWIRFTWGNEITEERARHAALNGADVFERPLPLVDFQGLARSVLLREFLFDLGLRVKGRTGNLFPLCRE